MAEIDLRAARRAYTAAEVADLVEPPPNRHTDVYEQAGARFHLLAYEAGVDLADPDDAATVCAVLYALVSTHSSLHVGVHAALHTAVAEYRKGIR